MQAAVMNFMSEWQWQCSAVQYVVVVYVVMN